MPYIPQDRRPLLNAGAVALGPGELNYQLSKMIGNYLLEYGISYRHLNDVLGVLTCVQHEVYRRLAAPYEDRKLAENGDVFDAGQE